jgi:hypothetical protein
MLIIMGGIGAAKLLQLSQSVKADQWQGWVFLFAALTLVAGFIVNEVAQTLRVATTMRRDYTFIQAQAYINEHWPKSTAVLMGQNITWSVPIQRDDTSISRARRLGASEMQSWSWWQSQPPDVRRYEYNIFGPELQAVLETREDVHRLLVNERIEYVIEADYCGNSESSAAAISPVEFPPIDSGMRSGLQLIQTFSPFDEGQNCRSGAGLGIYERTWLYGLPDVARFYRPGPIIRLYKVDFSAPVFNDSVILGNTN